MKQYVVVIFSIILIILLNNWQVDYIKKTSKYLLTDIEDVKNYIRMEDYEKAKESIKRLKNTWISVKDVWYIFGSHDDVKYITEHIESMKVYAEYEQKVDLINEYMLLETLITHVNEKEKVTFSNVL